MERDTTNDHAKAPTNASANNNEVKYKIPKPTRARTPAQPYIFTPAHHKKKNEPKLQWRKKSDPIETLTYQLAKRKIHIIEELGKGSSYI